MYSSIFSLIRSSTNVQSNFPARKSSSKLNHEEHRSTITHKKTSIKKTLKKSKKILKKSKILGCKSSKFLEEEKSDKTSSEKNNISFDGKKIHFGKQNGKLTRGETLTTHEFDIRHSKNNSFAFLDESQEVPNNQKLIRSITLKELFQIIKQKKKESNTVEFGNQRFELVDDEEGQLEPFKKITEKDFFDEAEFSTKHNIDEELLIDSNDQNQEFDQTLKRSITSLPKEIDGRAIKALKTERGLGLLNKKWPEKQIANQIGVLSILGPSPAPILPTFSSAPPMFSFSSFRSTTEDELTPKIIRKLHLAFLFSSPLVTQYMTSEGIGEKPMILLDYQREIKELQTSLKGVGANVKYRIFPATLDNLGYSFSENPWALHFSGHGIRSRLKKSNSELTDLLPTNEGDFLVFENTSCLAEYVSCTTLRKIVGDKKLSFVFVASCHSLFIGHVFRKVAEHVICIKRNEKVLDESARTFAKHFYRALFSGANSVCDSFIKAQNTVLCKFNQTEADKFQILPSHKPCTTFVEISPGQAQRMDILPALGSTLPPKVDDFVGRTYELYQIIKRLLEKRFITIKGFEGIGKTAVVKMLANLIYERSLFEDGVLFISLNEFQEFEKGQDIEIIINKMYEKCFLENNNSELIERFQSLDYPSKLKDISSFLKAKEVGIFIDNADNCINQNPEKFKFLLYHLLSEVPKCRIIVTARVEIGKISDLTESIVTIDELDKNSAITLFEKKSREFSEIEKRELIKITLNSGKDNWYHPKDKEFNLEKHELFEKLGGHPESLKLAAEILNDTTLSKLYKILCLDDQSEKESLSTYQLNKLMRLNSFLMAHRKKLKKNRLFTSALSDNSQRDKPQVQTVQIIDQLSIPTEPLRKMKMIKFSENYKSPIFSEKETEELAQLEGKRVYKIARHAFETGILKIVNAITSKKCPKMKTNPIEFPVKTSEDISSQRHLHSSDEDEKE